MKNVELNGAITVMTRDPREESGFCQEHFPLANGQPAPLPGTADKNDQIIIQFLAAYYQINCAYARLLQVRTAAQGGEAERSVLQQIEKILRIRDGLEDKHAPYGIVAEPVLNDGFTVNVIFSFGSVQSRARQAYGPLFSSAVISITVPEGPWTRRDSANAGMLP